MTLVKTSLLNGIAVAVKVASALVLNKILAVYVGPAGYAVIGQFQNAASIIVSLAGGVVATGVTKATAQHFDDEAKQHAFWQTAIRFSLVASVMAAIPLMFMGDKLSQWLLHRTDLSSVFVWLALALPAMAANNLLLAIVNGKKEVGIYVTANIVGSSISLLMVGLLAINFGLYGALVAFVINPVIVFLATAIIVTRRNWFKAKFLWGQINRPALRELSGFALMGLTSALTVPISYMLIRDHLATSLGLSAAGLWQASWKISEVFLMLITTTLTIYYLPRLAEIRTAKELKKEILNVYCFALPVVIICASTIYILRDFIIQTLLTTDFAPIRDLFFWQLMGDVLKTGAFVLAYIMLGRVMINSFVVTEIAFCVSFYLLTVMFVNKWGLQGVSIAYAVNYGLYWICMIYLVRHELNIFKKYKEVSSK